MSALKDTYVEYNLANPSTNSEYQTYAAALKALEDD
jgi:hypothetical protein